VPGSTRRSTRCRASILPREVCRAREVSPPPAGDLIEPVAEFGDQRAHGRGVACKVGRGGVGRGMKRHGLQRFMVRRNLGIGARIMVSLRCRLRQPGTFDPAGIALGSAFADRAPSGSRVRRAGMQNCRHRRLPARGLLRLNHLIGNTLALAISHGVFLGVEAKGELLLHVAGTRSSPSGARSPAAARAHNRAAIPGLGLPRLHRVFGGLKDTCGHGSQGPVRYATWKRVLWKRLV